MAKKEKFTQSEMEYERRTDNEVLSEMEFAEDAAVQKAADEALKSDENKVLEIIVNRKLLLEVWLDSAGKEEVSLKKLVIPKEEEK